MNNAALTIMYKVLCGHIYVFIILSICLGVELLGYMGTVFNFWRHCCTISKAATPYQSPVSTGWGFQFLFILANTRYCPFFFLCPLNCLGLPVKNLFTINIRAYFWTRGSVPLIYSAVFTQVLHSLDCCSSIASFEIRNVNPSFEIIFRYSGSFAFLYEFEYQLVSFCI